MNASAAKHNGNPEINAVKCDGCGACATLCPSGALRIVDEAEARIIEFSPAKCISCARCSEICPEHAVKMSAKTNLALLMTNMHSIEKVRLDLVTCENCHLPIGTAKKVLVVRERKGTVSEDKNLCDKCKRLLSSSLLARFQGTSRSP